MREYHFFMTAHSNPDVLALPDLPTARKHAVTKALELLWESPYRLHADPEWEVTVKDPDGKLLISVTLFEALGSEAQMTA